MSKVVILANYGFGHIYPTLGLATELIDRGEEVIYYSISQFRKHIESLGVKFLSYDRIDHYNVEFN